MTNAKLVSLFTTMLESATTYTHAADKVRAIRAEGAEIEVVRAACVAALMAKKATYKGDVQEGKTEEDAGKPGYFTKGSAGQVAHSKMMRATDPDAGERTVNQKVVRVPKELAAAIGKLLTTYDKAQIKAAMAKF
jgi:hypothetical protein